MYFFLFPGLFRIQEIIRILEKKRYYVTVRMRMLPEIHGAHEDLRALDKQELSNNGSDRYILLDLCKETHYHSIMRQV